MYPPEREQGSWNAFVSGVPSCRDSSGADSDLECILSAPTSQLYGSIQTLPGFITTSPYQPVIDTVSKDSLIPNFPSVLLQNLKGKKISVMIGANLDEGTVFSPQSIASNSDIQNLLINATSPTLPTTSPSTQNAYVQGLIDIYPENPSLNSPFNTGNETFGLSPSWKKYNSLCESSNQFFGSLGAYKIIRGRPSLPLWTSTDRTQTILPRSSNLFIPLYRSKRRFRPRRISPSLPRRYVSPVLPHLNAN